jgi:hypothetical protein
MMSKSPRNSDLDCVVDGEIEKIVTTSGSKAMLNKTLGGGKAENLQKGKASNLFIH